ncbi:hypothetical protein K3495_g5029 [Podosphaera aphanis]|nr:hypothetical protein K3495_g5029 [Podosphaera aphanis]
MVPKPLRRRQTPAPPVPARSRPWNPSTFFIVMFLLIGSNAIQMIALKKDVATFTRRADAKLGLLKEIVDRLQRGDAVDVARLLGTGDRRQEQEWDAVIHEIENDPSLAATQERLPRGTSGPNPAVSEQKMVSSRAIAEEAEVGKAPPGFF